MHHAGAEEDPRTPLHLWIRGMINPEPRGGSAFRRFLRAGEAVSEPGPFLQFTAGRAVEHLRASLAVRMPPAAYNVATMSAVFADGEYTHYGILYWHRGAKYIALGPTFSTQGGEFRPFLFWHDELPELGEAAEAAVMEVVRAGVRLEATLLRRSERLADYLDSSRLLLRALGALLLISPRPEQLDKTHVQPAYRRLLRTSQAALVSIPPRLRHQALGHFWTLPFVSQKLLPLAAGGERFDLDYSAWRECWVSELCGRLVKSRAAGGYPMLYQTFTLKAGAFLYETGAQRRHWRANRVARLGLVGEAARDRLPAPARAIAERAEKCLQLSEKSLLLVMERVGLETVNSHHVVWRSSLLRHPKYFRGWLFELCYCCHVLHERAGVAHNDLHLNNITLWPDAVVDPGGKQWSRAFIAGPGGEADTFLQPEFGHRAYIIDFGRVLVGPGAETRIQATGRSRAAVLNFYRNQLGRVLPELQRAAKEAGLPPPSAKQAGGQPGTAFAALAGRDFCTAGRNLRVLFDEKDPETAEQHRLTQALLREGEKFVAARLADLAAGRNAPGLPGLALLKKIFAEDLYAVSPLRKGTCTAFYDIGAEIREPDWADLGKAEQALGSAELRRMLQPGPWNMRAAV